MRKSTKNNHPTVSELTPKQRRFVAEYLKDQNAKQAAIRSGYSAKVAEVNGPRVLSNAKVRAAIDQKLSAIEDKCGITAEYVLNGLKEVAERCMQRVPVMVRDGRDMVQDTALIKNSDGTLERVGVWEFDSAGANRALELLGKYKQMFTENVRHSGTLTLEKLLAGTWDSVAP